MLAPGTDTRVDFERGMRTAPPLILLLIAANVALFAWELAAGAPGPSVGASGAIVGVVAAVVVALYRHQKRFYLRDKRIGFVLLVWAAYQISTGLLSPYIDNYGHLGGFAGGATAAWLLKPSLLSERSTG